MPIDIRPGGGPNPINPKSGGTVQVAILSTESFDATRDLDVDSLTFGRTGEEVSLARKKKDGAPDIRHIELNGDGRLDLLAMFVIEEANFQAGDVEGILRGQTFAGRAVDEWAEQADAAHALYGPALAGLSHHDEAERRRRG